MKKKLRNILLIDDSYADNFINKKVINKAAVAKTITTTLSGREALDYLTKTVSGQFPKPEIILLDINMPDMSGWDFLDEYMLLDEAQKNGIIMCVLTTSKANNDRAKATGYKAVNHYISKPLTQEKLMTIIEQHFSTYL